MGMCDTLFPSFLLRLWPAQAAPVQGAWPNSWHKFSKLSVCAGLNESEIEELF